MTGTDKTEMFCSVCSHKKEVPAKGKRALHPCPTCIRVTEFRN